MSYYILITSFSSLCLSQLTRDLVSFSSFSWYEENPEHCFDLLLSSVLSTTLKQMEDKPPNQRALPTYKHLVPEKRRDGFQVHNKYTWKCLIECVCGRLRIKVISKRSIAIIPKTSNEWVWGGFKPHVMDVKCEEALCLHIIFKQLIK